MSVFLPELKRNIENVEIRTRMIQFSSMRPVDGMKETSVEKRIIPGSKKFKFNFLTKGPTGRVGRRRPCRGIWQDVGLHYIDTTLVWREALKTMSYKMNRGIYLSQVDAQEYFIVTN
jgi:hypothetical protein